VEARVQDKLNKKEKTAPQAAVQVSKKAKILELKQKLL